MNEIVSLSATSSFTSILPCKKLSLIIPVNSKGSESFLNLILYLELSLKLITFFIL